MPAASLARLRKVDFGPARTLAVLRLARSPLRVAAPRVGALLLDSAVPPLDADLRFGLLLGDLDGPRHDLGLVVAVHPRVIAVVDATPEPS